MAGTLEYVPAPGSFDAVAEHLPASERYIGYVFFGGRWYFKDRGAPPKPGPMSELSVKLALMGLNPPVLAHLAEAVTRAKEP